MSAEYIYFNKLATGQKDDEKLIVRSICELTEKLAGVFIL